MSLLNQYLLNPVTQPGSITDNILSVGDGSASNKTIQAAIGGSNLPALRWNNGLAAWEFTNDGTTWNSFPTSATTYTKAQIDANYYTKAQTYTQTQIDSAISGASTGAIASGSIIMWGGSIGSIPAGFTLCNGQNGTPDLRDRFIVGAGNSFAVGATGGANTPTTSLVADHSHTGTTDSQGDHTHSASTTAAGQHNHGGFDVAIQIGIPQMPSHTHSTNSLIDVTGSGSVQSGTSFGVTFGSTDDTGGSQAHNHPINNDGSHTHSLTMNTAGAHTHTVTINNSGSHTHTVSSLPSYYALYFIQKN